MSWKPTNNCETSKCSLGYGNCVMQHAMIPSKSCSLHVTIFPVQILGRACSGIWQTCEALHGARAFKKPTRSVHMALAY